MMTLGDIMTEQVGPVKKWLQSKEWYWKWRRWKWVKKGEREEKFIQKFTENMPDDSNTES